MLVITKKKTLNLNTFEAVESRTSLAFSDAVVEAIKHMPAGGLFGGTNRVTEEIMRFYGSDANVNLGYARALAKDISEAWVRGDKSFDAEEWFNERKNEES